MASFKTERTRQAIDGFFCLTRRIAACRRLALRRGAA